MPIKTLTNRSTTELFRNMEKAGVSLGGVNGPYLNSSNFFEVSWDSNDVVSDIHPGRVSCGFSVATAVGAATVELLRDFTPQSETLVVVVARQMSFGGTFPSFADYVRPGTVEISLPGVSQVLVDDSSGNLVRKNQTTEQGARRGSIDYTTGVWSVDMRGNDPLIGAGNVTGVYETSVYPDSGDPPASIEITQITGPAGGTISIYADEAETALDTAGVLDANGVYDANNHLSIIKEIVDVSKRNRRWAAVSAAGTYFVHWRATS